MWKMGIDYKHTHAELWKVDQKLLHVWLQIILAVLLMYNCTDGMWLGIQQK